MTTYRPYWPHTPPSRRKGPLRPLLSSPQGLQASDIWSGRLQVTEIIGETPHIKTLRLRGHGKTLPFTFIAGQYVDVIAEIEGERINRAYSISSASTERHFIDLTVKREPHGKMSRHLCDHVQVGDWLEGRGPFGAFHFTGHEAKTVVLVGSGVGITPLVSIIRSLIAQNWDGQIHAIFGFRKLSDGLFVDEILQRTDENPGFHLSLYYTQGDANTPGQPGRVTPKAVKKAVPKLSKALTFVCGPEVMMEAMKTGLGVSKKRLRFEAFSPPEADKSLGGTYLIRFEDHTIEIQSLPGESILDVADRASVNIDNSCRTGTCGLCVAHLSSGNVDLIDAEALDEDDVEQGVILTCSAFPNSSCTIKSKKG